MNDFTACAREVRDEGHLESAVDDELVALWDDLDVARGCAINGRWSMACDSLTYRIMRLTLHTKRPTPWGHIQVDLLLDGTYEAIHEAIGMPTPLTPTARAQAAEVMADRGRL